MSDVQDDALTHKLGPYTLHGEVSRGGMATVHFGLLTDTSAFPRAVAIKRLHGKYANDPLFRDTLLNEAHLAARVRHPNVIAPLDAIAEGGELFLIMEYVHGESLSRLRKGVAARQVRIAPEICASIMVDVLHGLHAAHEAEDEAGRPLGIVHCDVSPQNVLVGVDGIARIIDFGIAKAADNATCVGDNSVKGKLPYMAPEQLGKAHVSRRADIYSASVVLWEIITGQRLFDAEEQGEIYSKIMRAKIEPPSAIAKEIPGELERLIQRGLSRNPEARFATAHEMAQALAGAIRLATPSIVGAFVEEIAADSLHTRGQLLAEMVRPRGATTSVPQL